MNFSLNDLDRTKIIDFERFKMEAAAKKELVQSLNWTSEEIQVLKDTVCKGLTDAELKVFAYAVRRTGLDPFMRQLYAVKRKNKDGTFSMTIQTGIDGYRLTADRTGLYAGSDDPVLDNEETPNKAVVTVYKMVQGVRCPFTASARWNEYYPGQAQGFMWDKMPCLMLGKVAEALALRKAFPAELSGIYTTEEMDQAAAKEFETDFTETEPEQPKVVIQPKSVKLVTEKQIDRLWRLQKTAGASILDVNSLVRAYGKEDPKQLTMDEYNKVCDSIVNGDWKNEDGDVDQHMSTLGQVAPNYQWKSQGKDVITGRPWEQTLERIKNRGNTYGN
jgi:phage recombination protein Bet